MTARTLARQTSVILRNDLRLLWRDYRTLRWRAFGTAGLLALILIVVHVFAFFIVHSLRQPPALGLEATAWVFFGFFMLGSTMNTSIGLLYEKADFDLLLGSPIDPRAVLLARLLSLGVSAFLSVGLFLLPLLNATSFVLAPRYFAGWLVWIFLAALSASAGVSVTLSLVRWLGVRRARVAVQVFAAVLGASVFLITQIPRMLPVRQSRAVFAQLTAISQHRAFTFLARGARAEPLPLAGLGLLAVGAVAVSTRRLSSVFISGSQDASSVVSPTRRRRAISPYRWAEGVTYATFRKDFRLIARDPLLLAQILPSAFYLIPGVIGFGRGGGIALIAPIAVVVAAQFSLLLTAVAAAGEQCWDLIRMSPSAEIRLRVAKMLAGMALPVGLATAICLVLAFAGRPWLALITLATALTTASACAWLQVTVIRPTARRDVLKKRGSGSIGRGIVSGALILSGALGVGMVSRGFALAGSVALIVLALGALACFTLAQPKDIDHPGGELG